MTARRKRSPLLVAGILFLVLIPAALLAARHPSKTQAAWFDPNWGYRTKIDIANSSGSTQTDFQVQIATDTASLITAGKMQVTCGDLRVTDNSGKLLNYWIEPNTCNTTNTIIWVKVPSIPTSGIPVYLYYGNPSATVPNYKTTDVFAKELSGSIATWGLQDTTSTQSYASVVNTTVATGRSILPNGDYELGSTTGVTAGNGATLSVQTTSPHGGTYLLRVARNGTNNPQAQATILVPGKNYRYHGWARSDGAATPTVYMNGGAAHNLTTSTSWQEFDYTETAPSAGSGIIIFRSTTSNATEYCEFDDITVTQVNIPSSGTATNILTDGDMETNGTSAWTSYLNYATLSKQSTSPHGGSQVLRVAYGTNAVTYAMQNNILTVGKYYRVSGYARSDGTPTPNIGGNGGILWTGTTSTTWQPIDFVFKAQTNGIGNYVAVGSQSNSSTHYVEFDDFTVTEDTITRPGELTQDGNMDAADVNSWSTVTNATITKQTVTRYDSTSGQVLRVAYNGSLNPYTHMIGQNLVIGKTYRLTGWARSDSASTVPKINDNVTYQWVGTASNTWQNIDITFVSTGTTLGLQGINGTSGYTEWDDLSIIEVSPQVGKFDNTNGIPTTKKPTLGTASGGHLGYAYSFNSANSQYLNIYSSDLNSAFNSSEGTLIIWAKVSGAGVWTDGILRYLSNISVNDGLNRISITKEASNNTVKFYYVAGGVTSSVTSTLSSTNWFQVVLSWSKSSDQVKTYVNGVQAGSTQTGLGTWSGNLNSTTAVLGTNVGGSSAWSGLINDVHLYNRALSNDEIASLYSSSSDIQAYTTNNYLGNELVRKFNSGVTTTPSYAEENSLNPVAYWKFDEGTGQIVNDSSSNKLNGTLGANSSAASDDPTWLTDDQCVSGKCLQFDGTADYVNIGNLSSLDFGTKDFTLSMWLKPTTITGNINVIRKGTYGSSGYVVWISNGVVTLYTYDSSGANFGSSAAVITANTWNHVEFSISRGGSSKIYINGQSVATSGSVKTGILSSSSSSFTIGQNNNAMNYYSGFIDEVKVYPYARTAVQVQADYNSRGALGGSGTSIGLQNNTFLNNGLVGYWKMDEATWSGTASEVVDSSGNGKNGTAAGPANAKAYPTAGKFGNAGFFDGVDNYVSGSQDGTTLTEFTYSLWFNTTTTTGNTGIFQWSNTLTSSQPMSYLRRNGASISVYSGGVYSSNASISPNTWYLATVTYKNNVTTLYLNGQSAATLNGPIGSLLQSHGTTIYPGNGYDGYFSGLIDDVRIYNRALSAGEISSLYNWAPGPAVYWNFDEKTGTTTNDSSGFGGNGTLSGTTKPSWTTGKYSGALSFDGANSWVAGPNTTNVQYNSGTLEAWINTTNPGSSYRGIVVKQSAYGIFLNSNVLYTYDWSTGSGKSASVSLNDGKWHHVTMSFQSGVTNGTILYVDGVQKLATTITVNSQAVALVAGAGNNAASQVFNGKIDDVRYYNYVRSPQQITEDMNGGHPTGGSPVGSQLSYWKFDEGSGTTAHDAIGNQDLVVTSATWKTNSDCKSNGCLDFDNGNNGSTAYYNDITGSIYDLTNDFSLEMWVNRTGTPTSQARIISKGDTYVIYTNTSNIPICHMTNLSPAALSATSALPLNTWTHIVCTYKNNVRKLYINGVLNAQDAPSGTISTNDLDLTIGNYDTPGVNYRFRGRIDEVKVYSSALTADQVKVDYNAGSSLNFGVSAASESAQLSDGAGNAPTAYWSFDEHQGNTVNDISGNNNTGTWGGTVNSQWTQGKLASAGNFNGTDYVDAGNVASYASNFTVSAWIYPTVIASNEISVLEKRNGTTAGWALGINANGSSPVAIWRTFSGGSQYSATSTINLTANNWYYLTVVHGSGNVSFYVNGKFDRTVNITNPATDTTAFRIGDLNGGAVKFIGKIDDVKIYNYARTQAQIAYDFNRGEPVALYRFDECQGSTIHDVSGNGNDGTWAGGTAVGTCTTPSTAWGNGVNGKFNASLKFTAASNDYVNIPGPATALQITGDITISSWVKTTNSGTYEVIVDDLGSSPYTSWCQWLDTAGKVVWYDNGSWRTSAKAVNDGNWHNIVTVVQNNNLSFYIDGVKDANTFSNVAARVATTDAKAIGRRADMNTYLFNGQIDEVRLYNYALSPTQISKLYNGGSSVNYGPSVGQP